MPGNRWTLYDFLEVCLKGFPARGIGSIDVTHRCNLSCRHCYFREQGHQDEASLSFWQERFHQLQEEGLPFYICGWLGGEPLLRPEIIEFGRQWFKSNVIFTNGTLELPPWPESTFVVSIHGTAPFYAEMTGANHATYRRVRRNADRPELTVYISCCVTRLNQSCLEEFVRESLDTGVKGVVFEFYTPTGSPRDQELALSWAERDQVLARVRRLKQRYGEFIYNSRLVLDLMHSDSSRRITEACPFLRIGFSFDPLGRPKEQCTLGPRADCSHCGCILPFFSEILGRQRYLFREFTDAMRHECKLLMQGRPSLHVFK